LKNINIQIARLRKNRGNTAQVREHLGLFGTSVNWDSYGEPKDAINKTKNKKIEPPALRIYRDTAANDALSMRKPPP